ncbi:MAG: DNA-3-methyladenine glycosylase family protein [Tepidimonas sp.]|uniref:DNA-3-methyladenine glycosylase family protein n=1 Tax=Tepidimonas sp. TaxID=2002775 RepID=UPI00405507B0
MACSVIAPLPAAVPTADGLVPGFWAEACDHLVGRDRVMARLIPQFPGACLRSRGDAFTTLARSVVGQQISVKAAQAVWDRLQARLGVCTPQTVLACSENDLRAVGLSARKVAYLGELARHFADGRLNPAAWHGMDDEAIIRELVAIRGIGRWTAEMFLIFCLLRPNVLPLDDVGLIRGISQLYFSGEPVSRSDAREVAAAWAPYRSVATWYIWRSLDPIPVAY